MTLRLLTAADCHLCAHGCALLDRLAADGLLEWREVDARSVEGRLLVGQAPPLRPVLFDEHGRVVGYGRLSERRLRRWLAASTGPGTLAVR